MESLYQLVIPSKSRSKKSFDDLLKMYKEEKTVSKSTRNMSTAEIKAELELNLAKKELGEDATPEDIKKKLAQIKTDKVITDEMVAAG